MKAPTRLHKVEPLLSEEIIELHGRTAATSATRVELDGRINISSDTLGGSDEYRRLALYNAKLQ